jgi:hypothetical protein
MREFRNSQIDMYKNSIPLDIEVSTVTESVVLARDYLFNSGSHLPSLVTAGAAPEKPIHSPIRSALVPLAFKMRGLMSDAVYLTTMYYLSLGSLPHFSAPKTFNEIVNHRKLYDRNPDFIVTSDKYAVRDYVAQRIGDEYLIPLVLHETNPLDVNFDRLPRACAVKLNHGSGFNILIRNKHEVKWEDILLKLQRWIRFSYYKSHREWAYREIIPRILVEELLQDPAGTLPDDYKLHVFHGKVRLIQVHYDRFGEQRINLFDEHYRLANVRYQAPPALANTRPPKRLNTMIEIAEKLAAGFSYARIDLYEHLDRVYFGEITHYPAAGIGVFNPPEFDRVLGDLWLYNRPIPEKYFTA